MLSLFLLIQFDDFAIIAKHDSLVIQINWGLGFLFCLCGQGFDSLFVLSLLYYSKGVGLSRVLGVFLSFYLNFLHFLPLRLLLLLKIHNDQFMAFRLRLYLQISRLTSFCCHLALAIF